MHADLLIRLHLNGLNVLVSTKCDIQKKNLFIHSLKRSPQNPEDSGGEKFENVPPEKKCTKTKGNHEEGLNLTLWVGHDCISCITVSSSLTTVHTVLHRIPTSSDVEISICTSWTCNNGNGHAVLVLLGNWCLEISPHVNYMCIYIYTHLLCLYIIYNI